MMAGHEALLDSGLDLEKSDRDEIGVFIGSGIGGLYTTAEQHSILLSKGPSRVSPFMIPMLILNIASGMFSIYHKLRGPNVATCSACATSSHAIGEAWRTIKMGDAQVMFAGGTEATIVPMGIGGFCAMNAMSTRNDDPPTASRPFDVGRDGFVMGEGAAVVVLEERGRALARGAPVYGEVVGYGTTNDAYHMTAPRPDGRQAARAMQLALVDGDVAPTEIGYVNAHGSSTPLNDSTETIAIKQVFGEHAYRLAVSGTKGYYGHALGASGAIETAICALTLARGWLPPTINLSQPDPACDLDCIPGTGRAAQPGAILTNSFGFGGINATLVLRRA